MGREKPSLLVELPSRSLVNMGRYLIMVNELYKMILISWKLKVFLNSLLRPTSFIPWLYLPSQCFGTVHLAQKCFVRKKHFQFRMCPNIHCSSLPPPPGCIFTSLWDLLLGPEYTQILTGVLPPQLHFHQQCFELHGCGLEMFCMQSIQKHFQPGNYVPKPWPSN